MNYEHTVAIQQLGFHIRDMIWAVGQGLGNEAMLSEWPGQWGKAQCQWVAWAVGQGSVGGLGNEARQ